MAEALAERGHKKPKDMVLPEQVLHLRPLFDALRGIQALKPAGEGALKPLSLTDVRLYVGINFPDLSGQDKLKLTGLLADIDGAVSSVYNEHAQAKAAEKPKASPRRSVVRKRGRGK